MANISPEPDNGVDAGVAPPGMPRWVKALGIGAVVVIAALVIIVLIVGGEHGPGLHSLGDYRAGPVTETLVPWT